MPSYGLYQTPGVKSPAGKPSDKIRILNSNYDTSLKKGQTEFLRTNTRIRFDEESMNIGRLRKMGTLNEKKA